MPTTMRTFTRVSPLTRRGYEVCAPMKTPRSRGSTGSGARERAPGEERRRDCVRAREIVVVVVAAAGIVSLASKESEDSLGASAQVTTPERTGVVGTEHHARRLLRSVRAAPDFERLR